jgi:hypothetical protein
MPFSWKLLKQIARSPLGRASFLIPFLPFIIDVLDDVVSAVGYAEGFIKTDVLSSLVEKNRNVVMTMYLGLFLFLVSRISFEIICPKPIKEHDDLEENIVDILVKMKLSKEAGDDKRYDVFRKRLDQLDKERHYLTQAYSGTRMIISLGFIFSILMLVSPAIWKFIRIFADYLWPF